MIETNPLVTVNILSFNRKDELRNTLTKVYEQDYKNIEVIVIDNASSDGSPEMVESEFFSVKLIRLKKNIGIAGWNEGFKIAKGEYILVLDDDSYPENTVIKDGIIFLDSNKEFSIVTFNIYNIKLKESETSQYKLINPYLFHGCGTILKKVVYNKLGGYDPNYFLYYNEIDYTIRCYNNNFKIRYLPYLKIFHQPLLGNNLVERNDYHTHKKKYEQYFTGHIRFLIKHFYLRYTFIYSIKWIFNRFIIAIFYHYYPSFFKTFLLLPVVIISGLRKRLPVDHSVQKYYNFGNKPLIDRWYFPNFKKPFIKTN